MIRFITLIVFILVVTNISAQSIIPTIRTYDNIVYVGTNGERGRFPHSNLNGRFEYDLEVMSGDSLNLSSEINDIILACVPGDTLLIDIVRLGKDDTLRCQFNLIEEFEFAKFTSGYQKKYKDSLTIQIPEVYELVNVLISLTQTGIAKRYVNSNTEYYETMKRSFSRFSSHKAVELIDSLLIAEQYHNLKMDSYAFEIIDGEFVISPVYKTLSWENNNSLLPYIDVIKDFWQTSRFHKFYILQKNIYDEMNTLYRDSLNIVDMITWLENNFPDVKYDSYKVVYSPLVGGDQSSWFYENNNFRELQAHVNFPFENNFYVSLPDTIASIVRGDIVFTELNHGFINIESGNKNYGLLFQSVFRDMSIWIDMNKPASNYQNPFACFNEYLNWSLVCLRYTDMMSVAESKPLIDKIENMMVSYRGFKKFKELNQFLIHIYVNKSNEQSLSDLYPLISTWFDINK